LHSSGAFQDDNQLFLYYRIITGIILLYWYYLRLKKDFPCIFCNYITDKFSNTLALIIVFPKTQGKLKNQIIYMFACAMIYIDTCYCL